MMIYLLLQYILMGVLGLGVLYILLFAIAGLFYRQPAYPREQSQKRIAVLIPGYKEDAVIVEAAGSALLQQYPQDRFEVVVIADSFKPETLVTLKQLPITVLEVSFDKSTKAKALNRAMDQLTGHYDILVVLDADNIMARDFLTRVNAAFELDYVAVQGHRTARNTNTSFAVLDAISEEINNHIFRKGHRVLGLSAAIIGSGMAFRYEYFRALMATATAVGGFDKEIELKILKDGKKIAYLHDALVYDEKVQQPEVFSNQRRRWLAAQFHYFKHGFPDACKALLLKGNIDYFDKAVQFIQPPRVLLLGAIMVLGAGFTLVNWLLQTGAAASVCWLLLMTGCMTALFLSIPHSLLRAGNAAAVAALPKGMWLMLRSLLKIKGANKTFIHTQHNSTSINTRQ